MRNSKLAALLISSGLLLTSCSGNSGTVAEETPSEPPEPTATATVSPSEDSAPSSSASHSPSTPTTEPSTESTTEMQTISKHEVTMDIPATWSVEPEEECDGECGEYTQWNLKNQEGTTVLILLPNTATSPDGDMNLYEREVLSQDSISGLTFQPTSVVAHHAVGTSQEDSEVSEFFSMAVVDDQVLAERGEAPDLDYFKTSEDAWPMLWVANEYLEATGYGDDQMSREQAEEFVSSEDFSYLNSIMKTVRITENT